MGARLLIHDLGQGESVLLMERRHPVSLMPALAGPCALLVLWISALVLSAPRLGSGQQDPLISDATAPPVWLPGVLFALWIIVLFSLLSWLGYVLLGWRDTWLALTTRRVIFMDKAGPLHEIRHEAPLEKVENVLIEYTHPFSLAFDFGTVTVDTAGAGTLEFKSLPAPKAMRDAIFAQQQAISSGPVTPEEKRKVALQNVLWGHSLARPGLHDPEGRSGRVTSTGSGIGAWVAYIFPVVPQRQGTAVVWHKHPYFLVKGLAMPVLAATALLMVWLLTVFAGESGVAMFLSPFLAWIVFFSLPVCAVWAIWRVEDWRNSRYKLDAERVYEVASLPFGLREESRETLISKVTDVAYSVQGPLASFLNFGDVVIRTPGESVDFVFRGIPSPREVQREVMGLVERYRAEASQDMDREFEAWIKAYDDLRGGRFAP